MKKLDEIKSFYRKYRPNKIDDISGHELIKKILKKQLEKDNIPHALIFSGQRGTGKTSIAKIIAKTLNCEQKKGYLSCEQCSNCIEANKNSHPDIFDIDGASNNGVDEIRQININISLMPILGKYKVYIIDEVHMLTNSAFNAFLKTLEEPPKHIVFILATTELHSIPNTIISRCQIFNLRQINKKDITNRINYICKKENINIDEESINELVDLSDGSLRDAINNLDQLNSYCCNEITIDKFKNVFCVYTKNEKINLILAIVNNNIQKIIGFFKLANNEGLNFKVFSISLINIIRDVIEWKLINLKNNGILLEGDYKKFTNIDLNTLFEIGNQIIEAYSKTNNNVFNGDYLLLVFLEIANKNNKSNENNKYVQNNLSIEQEINNPNLGPNNNNLNNNYSDILNNKNIIENVDYNSTVFGEKSLKKLKDKNNNFSNNNSLVENSEVVNINDLDENIKENYIEPIINNQNIIENVEIDSINNNENQLEIIEKENNDFILSKELIDNVKTSKENDINYINSEEFINKKTNTLDNQNTIKNLKDKNNDFDNNQYLIENIEIDKTNNINDKKFDHPEDYEDILFTQNVSRETIEDFNKEEIEEPIYSEEYFDQNKKLWCANFINNSTKKVIIPMNHILNALNKANQDQRTNCKEKINNIFNYQSIEFDKELAKDLLPLYGTKIICASQDSIMFCEELGLQKENLNLFFQNYKNRERLFKYLDKELAIIVVDIEELKNIKPYYLNTRKTFLSYNFDLDTYYDEILVNDEFKTKIVKDAEIIFGKGKFKVV